MPLPKALEEWMEDPTQVRPLVLRDMKITGDPDTGADKISCRIFDKQTGEELLDLSVVGWVGLYASYESLKEALLNEARRRLRAQIDLEVRRRAKAAAFAAIQSTLPTEDEAEVALENPPVVEEEVTTREEEQSTETEVTDNG